MDATIPEASFSFWESQASQKVRQMTFENIDETVEIEECVQMCVCELATILYESKQANDDVVRGVLSEKDGQWGATYESTAQQKQNEQQEIKSCIVKWLANTGYLFGGV